MENCLSNFVPGFYGHTIHVKILKKFHQFLDDGSKASMLIMVDALGSKIVGVLDHEIPTYVSQILQKGQWCSVTNFDVVQVKDENINKSFHSCQIHLSSSTIVKLIDQISESWYYNFVAFGQLINGSIDGFKVVDLICKVVSVEDILFLRNRTEENRFSDWMLTCFKAEDENGVTLECIALGDHAKKFTDAYKEIRRNQTAVCLLRWWAINSYNGAKSVQTLGDISDIELNPDIPEVEQFLSLSVISLSDDDTA